MFGMYFHIPFPMSRASEKSMFSITTATTLPNYTKMLNILQKSVTLLPTWRHRLMLQFNYSSQQSILHETSLSWLQRMRKKSWSNKWSEESQQNRHCFLTFFSFLCTMTNATQSHVVWYCLFILNWLYLVSYRVFIISRGL